MALPMIATREQVSRMSPENLDRYFMKAARYVGDLPGGGHDYAIMFGTKTLKANDTMDLKNKLRAEVYRFRRTKKS